jgi:hypothetical protein
MESFELKVDTNTIYVKIIRFLGTLMLGFFLGAIVFIFKYAGSVSWVHAFIGITCSLTFAFFPGAAVRQALIVNEDGIFLNNYSTFWGTKEYNWSTIKAVEVKKHTLELTRNIGSTERVKLPLHTDEQIEKLKTYLSQLTGTKEIVFKQ